MLLKKYNRYFFDDICLKKNMQHKKLLLQNIIQMKMYDFVRVSMV